MAVLVQVGLASFFIGSPFFVFDDYLLERTDKKTNEVTIQSVSAVVTGHQH